MSRVWETDYNVNITPFFMCFSYYDHSDVKFYYFLGILSYYVE